MRRRRESFYILFDDEDLTSRASRSCGGRRSCLGSATKLLAPRPGRRRKPCPWAWTLTPRPGRHLKPGHVSVNVNVKLRVGSVAGVCELGALVSPAAACCGRLRALPDERDAPYSIARARRRPALLLVGSTLGSACAWNISEQTYGYETKQILPHRMASRSWRLYGLPVS